MIENLCNDKQRFSDWKKYMLRRGLLIVLLFLGFSNVHAQSVLTDSVSFNDQRMNIARKYFYDAYRGVTDFTFDIDTSFVGEEQFELAVSVMEQYALELGGRRVEKKAKFQLKLARTSWAGNLNNWQDNYVLRLSEYTSRGEENLATYVGRVSCAKPDIIGKQFKNTLFLNGISPQYYQDGKGGVYRLHCRLSEENVKDMLLRLSFSQL